MARFTKHVLGKVPGFPPEVEHSRIEALLRKIFPRRLRRWAVAIVIAGKPDYFRRRLSESLQSLQEVGRESRCYQDNRGYVWQGIDGFLGPLPDRFDCRPQGVRA